MSDLPDIDFEALKRLERDVIRAFAMPAIPTLKHWKLRSNTVTHQDDSQDKEFDADLLELFPKAETSEERRILFLDYTHPDAQQRQLIREAIGHSLDIHPRLKRIILHSLVWSWRLDYLKERTAQRDALASNKMRAELEILLENIEEFVVKNPTMASYRPPDTDIDHQEVANKYRRLANEAINMLVRLSNHLKRIAGK